MAKNGRAPSMSFVSKNNSLEGLSTLSNSSPIKGGASGGNTISLSNNNNYGECYILPRETKEKKDITTPSNSKGRRGRPSGSKNKPKPPIIIKEDSNQYLEPIVIEIPTGNEVVKAIIEVAYRHHDDITVLRGSGYVFDITLCHPQSHTARTFSINGHLRIISLTGTYMSGPIPPVSPSNRAFSSVIHRSRPLYQVLCGVAGGKLVCASRMLIVASMFKKLEYHNLPFINGSVEEVEMGDHKYNGVNNVDVSGPRGITNNIVIVIPNDMSAFSVINSTPLNSQLPPP